MSAETMHPEAQKRATETLVKVVNSTGFPLQLGIRRQVEETYNTHRWSVLSMEHPWKNPETDGAGYADLILLSNCKSQVMIIECKRMLDVEWIFLTPTANRGGQPRHWTVANAWISHGKEDLLRFGWEQMQTEPVGYRSEFCGIPKMDNKATTMLERIGSELIDATEAIADQERLLCKGQNLLRAYHPVIITSAPLKVCKFSTADVNEKGEIIHCEFEEVPFVRFHKCLGGRLGDLSKSTNLPEVLKEHERTIYVVNASKIVQFLENWEYTFPDGIVVPPWFAR